jgi:hypothetical protein
MKNRVRLLATCTDIVLAASHWRLSLCSRQTGEGALVHLLMKGLFSRSVPMVVVGPWPGITTVSSGSSSSFP